MTDRMDTVDSREFEKRLQRMYSSSFELAYDIDDVCHKTREALKTRHKTDYDPGSLPHNILFVRAWRLWHSVIRLAKQGYAIEALILARAIWETRVHLGYLCADFTGRTIQFRRYFDLFRDARLASIAIENPDRLHDAGLARPDYAKLASALKLYVQQYGDEKTVKSFMKRAKSDVETIVYFQSGSNWMLKSIKDAADSFGAKLEYEVFYPPTSRMAHGGMEGFIGFTWYLGDKTIIEAGPSVKQVSHALAIAGQFMAACIQEIDDVLGFGLASDVQEINRKLLVRIKEVPDEEIRAWKAFMKYQADETSMRLKTQKSKPKVLRGN